MTLEVTLVVMGEPVAWQRAGRHGRQTYTPAKMKRQEERIRAAYTKEHDVMLTGQIEASYKFVYEPPGSLSHKKRNELMGQPKLSRPDRDNLVKLVEDALSGAAYLDDKLIYKATSEKVYGPEAMTVIKLKGEIANAEEVQ